MEIQIICNCTDKVNVHFCQFARNSLLSMTFYWNKFNFVSPNNSAPFYRGSIFQKCVPLWLFILFIGYFSILSNSKVFPGWEIILKSKSEALSRWSFAFPCCWAVYPLDHSWSCGAPIKEAAHRHIIGEFNFFSTWVYFVL